jgi:hypothetical protein
LTSRRAKVFFFEPGGRDLKPGRVDDIIKVGFWDGRLNPNAIEFPHYFKSGELPFRYGSYNRQVVTADVRFRTLKDLQNTVLKGVVYTIDGLGRYNFEVTAGVFYCTMRISKARETRVELDYVTGLVWQRYGFSQPVPYYFAELYIYLLNELRLGNSDDWRLPTLEEALSLMKPSVDSDDPEHPDTIWTSDHCGEDIVWAVSLSEGSVLKKGLSPASHLSFRDEYCSHALAVR